MNLGRRLAINPSQIRDGTVVLTPEQSHYLRRVLRLKKGDRFVALDGQGRAWIAQILVESAQIIEPLSEFSELSLTFTLIVALPKGNGFDEIVRCGTELGVTAFVPVISQRTLLVPSPHKLERWRKIATEATELSERQLVPVIEQPISWSEALINVGETGGDRYICVTRRKVKHLLTYLNNIPTNTITVATGCEGGWTDAEIESAIAAGFQPVSLGGRILRAITAPIMVASLVASVVERD